MDQFDDNWLSKMMVSKENSMTKKYELASKFTEYHLYFRTATSEGRNPFCIPRDLYNVTEMVLMEGIDTCANENYLPRVLYRNQITWKNTKQPKSKGNTTDTAELNKTDTDEKMVNPPDDVNEDDNQRVHKYLVFALLLPNHPYSEDMQEMIRVVAPMFPSVTVVAGSAYEFRDMASKYIITSFPKLLFFQAGIYSGTFDESVRDPMTVAAQFSKWTKSLPQSYPINSIGYKGDLGLSTSPVARHSPAIEWHEIVLNSSTILESLDQLTSQFFSDTSPILPSANLSSSSLSSLSSLSTFSMSCVSAVLPSISCSSLDSTHTPGGTSFLHQPVVLSIPYFVPAPNIEPFLGSVELFRVWDAWLFLLSGVYFVARTIYLANKCARMR